jgi:signal transduction histidine kinase
VSLVTKITRTFAVSSFVLALFLIFQAVNFFALRREIKHLQIADTIIIKSLQLRRYEKNFFLYWPVKADEESKGVRESLRQLNTVFSQNPDTGPGGSSSRLQYIATEYGQSFQRIEPVVKAEALEFNDTKRRTQIEKANFFPLTEITFAGVPLPNAHFPKRTLLFQPGNEFLRDFNKFRSEVMFLRKNGEDLLTVSEKLRQDSRASIAALIHRSQVAMVVFFIVFFIAGMATFVVIGEDVVSRLKLLAQIADETGKGAFPDLPAPPGPGSRDEIGTLIRKFNEMGRQLARREEELKTRNMDALQSKKLGAIGTLASGIARELNDPLNDIHSSITELQRELDESCLEAAADKVEGIVVRATKMKRILNDLHRLGRETVGRRSEIELNGFITRTYDVLGRYMDIKDIRFVLDCGLKDVVVQAVPEQMERVFLNIFTNAVEAMHGNGDLTVRVEPQGELAVVKITDTGQGIPGDVMDRIFEPFFTTKDKGAGLGLAVAYSILKKHDGSIRVESNPGKGACFSIALPLFL